MNVVVGSSPGGGLDFHARALDPYITKNIPGNPKWIIRNMPGGSGTRAINFLNEKAKPNGLTIYHSSWNPVDHVTRMRGLRADYTKLNFIGANAGPNITIMRLDTKPGIRKVEDVLKLQRFKLGATRSTSNLSLQDRTAFDALGVKYSYVPGYRMSTLITALHQNEVQAMTSSGSAYRNLIAPDAIKSKKTMPLWYFPKFDKDGKLRTDYQPIKNARSFVDVYHSIKGKDPSGLPGRPSSGSTRSSAAWTRSCSRPGTRPRRRSPFCAPPTPPPPGTRNI